MTQPGPPRISGTRLHAVQPFPGPETRADIVEDALSSLLEALFQQIDDAYCDLTQRVGFSCAGCDAAKCCTVDLTVRTFEEIRMLRQGFDSLDSETQAEIIERSRKVIEAKRDNPNGDSYRSALCVLHFDGLCSLYRQRPMICRLMGIPHVIHTPTAGTKEGPGCATYRERIEPVNPDLRIDRTHFYREMAKIELVAVNTRGERTKPQTIAEIFCPPLSL